MSKAGINAEEAKRKLLRAANELRKVSGRTSYAIVKSMAFQTAKNAIKTTKSAKAWVNKAARSQSKASSGKARKWAFGEAEANGQHYDYGAHELKFLKKFGVVQNSRGRYVPARWRGSSLKMERRGLAKAAWYGVLRKLSRQYRGAPVRQDRIPKGSSEFRTNGLQSNSRSASKLSNILGLGARAEIANSTKPITFLDRRDGLAIKAMNMTRGFIRHVMLPDARRQLASAWK